MNSQILFCVRCLMLPEIGIWKADSAATIYKGMALCMSHLEEVLKSPDPGRKLPR